MKQITALLLTILLLLSLCACGAKDAWQEQYDLGMRYLNDGNYEEAIIAFTAAIEIDEKRPEGYEGRGRAYVLSGETAENLEAAKSDFEKALELDPTYVDAWLDLADIYIRQGDYDKAKEILKEALDKTGGDQSIASKLEEVETGIISGGPTRLNVYDAFADDTQVSTPRLNVYFEYTYDDDGRVASISEYSASSKEPFASIDLSYDENGNELVGYCFATVTSDVQLCQLLKTENEYDSSGKRIKTLYYWVDYLADETLIDFYTVYHYDSAGIMTGYEKLPTDPDPEWNWKYVGTLEYDENGTLISIREEYFSSGQSIGTHFFTFEYDGNGNCIKCIEAYNESYSVWWEFRYDDAGNCIGETCYMGSEQHPQRIYATATNAVGYTGDLHIPIGLMM